VERGSSCVQGGGELEYATCAGRNSRVLLKRRERLRGRANIEQRLGPDQIGYNMNEIRIAKCR
jgi:hypothetical protein